MKRIICALITIFLLLNNIPSYANEPEYVKELKGYGIEPFEFEPANLEINVQRYHATVLVCQSVGYSETSRAKIANTAFYGFEFTDINQIFVGNHLLRFAGLKRIIFGINGVGGIFEPERPATYEEAVAIASRCIAPPQGRTFEEMDLNETWEFAKENNLIEDGEFDDRRNDYITYNDIYKILSRLIDKEAYIDADNDIGDILGKTYREVLDLVGYDQIHYFRAGFEETEPGIIKGIRSCWI